MVHRLVVSYEGRAAGRDLATVATGGVTSIHVAVQTASAGR